MKTKLRMKCPNCSHWNRFGVEKVLFNPDNPAPKAQVFIPSYLPLREEKCSECGSVIATEKELIRIVHKP